MAEKTERGFGIYGRVTCRNDDTWRVQESSLAGEGAHVRIIPEKAVCSDWPAPTPVRPHGGPWKKVVVPDGGHHLQPDMHLSVAEAKKLRDALNEFIRAAEADTLMEPAEVPQPGLREGEL